MKLIISDTVVAVKYFKPQKRAPLPMVKEQIPIIKSLIHTLEDREINDLMFGIKKGIRIIKARKYRKNAMVKGSTFGSRSLIKTKDVAHIIETKMPMKIAIIGDKTILLFARIISDHSIH